MAVKRERDALADWVLGRKKTTQPEEKKAEKKDDQPKKKTKKKKKPKKKKKAKGNPDRVDLIRRCYARRRREKQQISEEMASDV